VGAVLAPSILSADFAALGDAVREIEAGGAALVHFDAMDGKFVPNLTIGAPVAAALARVTSLPLDCHLMIDEPAQLLPDFIDAGAEMISVHVEADRHLHRSLQVIRAAGVKAGVAINPGTPLVALDPVLADADFVVLMSVNPGFGGQSFIPSSMERLRKLRQTIDERGLATRIEIDGGVTLDNVEEIAAAGADMIVAGSAVFGGGQPQQAARTFVERLAAVAERSPSC
jgi:ribulose-phosphate 3-epimerase